MSTNVSSPDMDVLTPSEALAAMRMADLVKDAIFLWGRPGIGKSQISKQYADTYYPLRKDNIEKLAMLKARAEDPDDEYTIADYNEFESTLLDQETNFVDFRLSQIEPSDLRGIPVPTPMYFTVDGVQIKEWDLENHDTYVTETAISWAAPKVLKLPKDWKGVIMYDEMNSAMPIVQAASYQLVLDRCVGELTIPDGAFQVAAGNGEKDGGVTFQLATPLRDRMTHIEIRTHAADWIESYAVEHRIYPKIIAYLNETGDKNFNTLKKDDKSHAGGSSPRSWVTASNYEYKFEEMGASDDPKMAKLREALLAGRLSSAVAIDYCSFVKRIGDVPNSMDILYGKKRARDVKSDISSYFFLSLNLSYKMVDIANLMKKDDAPFTHEQWCHMQQNYLRFIDEMFSQDYRELNIMAMKFFAANDYTMSYRDVPEFKNFVNVYMDLIRESRS